MAAGQWKERRGADTCEAWTGKWRSAGPRKKLSHWIACTKHPHVATLALLLVASSIVSANSASSFSSTNLRLGGGRGESFESDHEMRYQTSSGEQEEPSKPAKRRPAHNHATEAEREDQRVLQLKAGGQGDHLGGFCIPWDIKRLAKKIDELETRIVSAGEKALNAEGDRQRAYWTKEQQRLQDDKQRLQDDKQRLQDEMLLWGMQQKIDELETRIVSAGEKALNAEGDRQRAYWTKEQQRLQDDKQDMMKKQKLLLELIRNREMLRLGAGSVVTLEWQEIDINADLQGFREGNNLFFLDRLLLLTPHKVGAGLCVLYCREDFNRQWQFLEQAVCREGCLGFILGPPGTGKTTTALAFMHSLDIKEWSVMCIRIWGVESAQILQAVNGITKTCNISLGPEARKTIEQVLKGWPGNGKKFLFLDGYLHHSPEHQHIQGACNHWRNGDRSNRRLVVATSLSSRGKTYPEKDTNDMLKEMVVYSWTLKEFQEAVKYDLLYSSVADVINDGTNSKRETLIESKYQVVGGSCRYMFEYPTERAVQDFRIGMESISNYEDFLTFRIGQRSSSFVNRLFARYKLGRSDVWAPISKLVATELAANIGESFVSKLMKSWNPNHPVIQGYAFEMLFFARMSKGQRGVVVTNSTGHEQAWGPIHVESFDPKKGYDIPKETKKLCLKPEAWNQGGYDAVVIDQEMLLVRFVQVTRQEKHDLKLQYFSNFLRALGIKRADGWSVEIVFVVDIDKVNKFQVGEVEHRGALSRFGWDRGKEKNRVEVWGMESRAEG